MGTTILLIVIVWVCRTAYNNPRSILWTIQSHLKDRNFADDIYNLSHHLQDYQQQDSNLETTTKRAGLFINLLKTKTMRINSSQEKSIQIRGTEIEKNKEFTYL